MKENRITHKENIAFNIEKHYISYGFKFQAGGAFLRILGIDYGEKQIGVALSDETYTIASSLCVINVSKDDPVVYIKDLVGKYDAEKIVVGMPYNLNGTEGERVNITRHFINDLQDAVDIDVVEWDERLSTKFSDMVLNEAKVKGRKKKKKVIDKIAAAFILQGYLDYLANEYS